MTFRWQRSGPALELCGSLMGRMKCIENRSASWSCRAIDPRAQILRQALKFMPNAHFKFWPSQAMHNLIAPATNMFYNAEVSARRFPNKPFLVYYDTKVTFKEFHDEAERVAGYLEQRCGVRKGDRVLLLMQNSPQFMIGYYGILRANAWWFR
jgi:hypothetical protein